MKRNYVIALLLVGLLGCSSNQNESEIVLVDSETGEQEQVPSEMTGRLEEIANQQAKSLEKASVSVKAAYNYKGYSYIEPVSIAKLIAVDVEFSKYGQNFDLDDVDIIDSDTDENYGSDPQIVLLNKEGEILPDDTEWPEAPGPIRVLLIYAFPKDSKSVKLGYWGSVITDKSVKLEEGGPVLKNPEKQDSQSTLSDGQ